MYSDDIIAVLNWFSPLFSYKVWTYAQILLIGAILCHKERTVTAILRVMGFDKETHFINYHRVLNRACWSGLQASKILLGLLVKMIPASWPIIIGIDDTIERCKGKKIKAKCKPEAFFSTDIKLYPIQIVEYYIEESRRHLGVETQRQWSDKAISRATPALMALFSIVCLTAYRLSKSNERNNQLTPKSTAWYQKQDVTFSDVLAFVRRHIWENKYSKSVNDDGYVLFHIHEWDSLLDQLVAVA